MAFFFCLFTMELDSHLKIAPTVKPYNFPMMILIKPELNPER